MLKSNHSEVSMMVADGLTRIWNQGNINNYDDASQTPYILRFKRKAVPVVAEDKSIRFYVIGVWQCEALMFASLCALINQLAKKLAWQASEIHCGDCFWCSHKVTCGIVVEVNPSRVEFSF